MISCRSRQHICSIFGAGNRPLNSHELLTTALLPARAASYMFQAATCCTLLRVTVEVYDRSILISILLASCCHTGTTMFTAGRPACQQPSQQHYRVYENNLR